MMLSKSLRNIKNLHDLRIEKVHLRYESMRAEDAMNDSLSAIGKMFTVFTFIQKTGRRLKFVYGIFSGIAGLVSRFLYKKVKRKDDTHYTSMEDD